jgi:hypothetical protein
MSRALPVSFSLSFSLCAALAVLAASACEQKARPWAGKDGPPSALSPPPPGATAEVGATTEPIATAEVKANADVSATAVPVVPPQATEAPAPAQAGAAGIVPGGPWVKCAEGLTLSDDPLKDVTRLGMVCGLSTGMRRKTQQAIVGVIGEHEPPVAVELRVARGACYRVFAVADAQVAELDVTVRSSRDVAVAADHAAGRLAIVQTDRPFCTFAADVFSLEVTARRGSGRFAAEVWSLGEPRRKGEVPEGPADEGPIEKP